MGSETDLFTIVMWAGQNITHFRKGFSVGEVPKFHKAALSTSNTLGCSINHSNSNCELGLLLSFVHVLG